jgi:menaquinone-dependent protoporphyrinogen oxidase
MQASSEQPTSVIDPIQGNEGIMTRLLVAYGTTEGHTRRICEFIADIARRNGCEVTLIDSAAPEAGRGMETGYDAAILAASVHEGKHQSAMTHFVKDNMSWLNQLPGMFLSVSLAIAAEDPKSRAEAQDNLRRFLEETGWQPAHTRCVAGALLYTRYNFLKRFVMHLIAQRAGGGTDTSCDYDYTDWIDLRNFITDFLVGLRPKQGNARG